MGKYNRADAKPAVGKSPIVAVSKAADATNYHQAPGFARDLKSELFILGVANMAGQDTFYEKAAARDTRYAELVREVAVIDPAWTKNFLRWLRNDAYLRSASLVGALEAAKAMLDAKIPGARSVVASVLSRADEPGEALGYWTSNYGRAIPKPVKRGIADAVTRLYNEYTLLKYDTATKGYRFGDVLNLVHPTARDSYQAELFKHALERRYGRETHWAEVSKALPMLMLNASLRKRAAEGWVTPLLDSNNLQAAGMTWEAALSLAGDKVDKRTLWTALIPTMGYMALLRNLRNFDQAGIEEKDAEWIARKLADPEQVADSKQFPFRFYAAYLATQNSLRWGHTLEKALQLSLANVPALPGNTLVLVDQSPSMFPEYGFKSLRSDMSNADVAKLFGSAVALRAEKATLVGYGRQSSVVPFQKGDALLKVMQRFNIMEGTDTFGAVHRHFGHAHHDRIVIITDEQNQQYRFSSVDEVVFRQTPIYLWNIGGYPVGSIGSGPNRNTFAGLTDAAFRAVPLIEAGKNAAWPWEAR